MRIHETTRERPIDRFEKERALLRPLPAIPFDTDEVVPAVVSPHARIAFDGNRYSAPPQFVRRPLTLRANRDEAASAARRPGGGAARPQLRAWPTAGAARAPPGRAQRSANVPRQQALDAGIRRLGTRGTRIPPASEQPSGQDQRPSAPLAEPGPDSTGGPRCWPPSATPWN